MREKTQHCANEGCQRQAAPGEPFCETCGIERELFLRDTREHEKTEPPAEQFVSPVR